MGRIAVHTQRQVICNRQGHLKPTPARAGECIKVEVQDVELINKEQLH